MGNLLKVHWASHFIILVIVHYTSRSLDSPSWHNTANRSLSERRVASIIRITPLSIFINKPIVLRYALATSPLTNTADILAMTSSHDTAMEHYAPHESALFEGYYSKFDLPSGAHIALIICSVPDAKDLPSHMVSFTYYSKSGSSIYHREHFVPEIHRITIDKSSHAFELRVPGMGLMSCDGNSKTTYDLKSSEWRLRAETTGRLPWDLQSETPEGWIVRLPLPLHWHVHSLRSPCNVEVDIASFEVETGDRLSQAVVHQEKNWANSFPSAHIWVQACSPSTGSTICLAGGKILGMTAYLLGYRSSDVDISFRPPISLAIFGLSPFMTVDVDWENRAFSLCVSGFWRKIEVQAKAPKGSGWFGISAPFSEGFRKNFLTESFLADVDVHVSERGWLGGWKQVKRETFANASLEFGGAYFPERGEKND